jgi:Xaa-Pro aminopeptidase
MNAYTTRSQARILPRDIAALHRADQYMIGASLAALERQREWQAEAEVDWLLKQHGVTEFQRHHTGHGIGLEGHEWPFIDKGSDDVIEEMMVLTIEPGIYVSGLAGFRHSDTVVVRANGVERLTYYPRDLQSMIVAP